MLRRYSSRRASLIQEFLQKRLTGATRYDRIAGYFQSSLLELANDEMAAIPRVRIVCNTEVNPGRPAHRAHGDRRPAQGTGERTPARGLEQRPVPASGRCPWRAGAAALPGTADLLCDQARTGGTSKFAWCSDAEFGFVHGKGGVIEGPEGATSFIGSANDSANAWTKNYELVWEDDHPESVAWLQEEFDALWAKGFPPVGVHRQAARAAGSAHRHRACRRLEGESQARAGTGGSTDGDGAVRLLGPPEILHQPRIQGAPEVQGRSRSRCAFSPR